jgi:hypothetical protein
LNCHTFTALLGSRKQLPVTRDLLESILAFLGSEDCQNDTYFDALMLAVELSLVNASGLAALEPFLKGAPFRGIGAQLSEWLVPNVNPLDRFPLSNICLESEMNRTIEIYARMGHQIMFPVKALSPLSLDLVASLIARSFVICFRYNVAPPYSEDAEQKLTKQIPRFGVSPFLLTVLEKWVADRDIIGPLNAVLAYAANNGTYYVNRLATLMGNAMMLHKSVLPVVEAFVLALDDTPLKKALQRRFRAAVQRQDQVRSAPK